VSGRLERLGRQAIDLYLVLEPEPSRSVEETWETAAVADEGLTRRIGVSNLSAQFSLIHREEHEALREHCVRAGTVTLVQGPATGGCRLTFELSGDGLSVMRIDSAPNRDVVERS